MPLPFYTSLDRKLIKLVENNPILYDSSYDGYLEAHLREEVWNKIGDELEVAAPLCKSRWVNIRDNMRRKLRRDHQKKISGENIVNKYKYEKELAFLVPYFKLDPVKEGQNQEGSVESEDMDTIYSQETDDSDHQVFFGDAFDNKSEITINENPLGTSFRETGGSQKTSIITNTGNSDPINVFLDAVGATLRNLNPYYLNVAKSKIFQIAQECEMQQILSKGEIPSNSNN